MGDFNVISVLWSGGMDSTYLIQHLLDKDPKNVVWASYVEIENNRDKVVTELAAISKMEPFLKDKYKDRFHYLGVACKFSINNMGNNLVFYQMPLWIAAVICTTNSKVNEIAVGYVMNDCAISYLAEFQQLIKSFDVISHDPYPKISFPLSKVSKDFIVSNIYAELKQHVVWCERPKDGHPCGKCHSCERSPILKESKDTATMEYMI